MSENPEEGMKPGQTTTLKYIINDFDCGSRNKKQTVRAWLEKFGIPLDDEYFIRWNEVVVTLVDVISKVESKLNRGSQSMEMMWNMVFSMLYVNYDTQKEFTPQFEANSEKAIEFCESIKNKFLNGVKG